MCDNYINLEMNNIAEKHLCCAISDKKHQIGVDVKRSWLAERISEGHVFRKLDAKGKVFIEYAPLETAWVPVNGENYIYIYCFWVSGSFKSKGHGKKLLEYCIEDAKRHKKSGICVISSKKKTPFLTDKKYMQNYGFEVVDAIGDYELLALSFDDAKPIFTDNARKQAIDDKDLTIYYSKQCPYIPNCIEQVELFCQDNNIPLNLIEVDNLEKAKSVPGVFNNYAVFYKGKFKTIHLLNEGYLKKKILM
ncbi:acetyltransferase (GNAT) family protein [Natranaerovirga pectinivora]|uniref:Acetyltransferase (GNAT) family protein n=1 Tax=Natranaerovirga pectinivora TaxID=682400 RepID=A0A4R3MG92_9FIRM|nr:N-acetyltransferase [Natranaerovirga pectinivora]TCT12196.1 acetyltransferase (GNAT) family protein [Natranaerovirga pectinivora]